MTWNDYVDRIFLINLPDRHDRLVDSIIELNQNKLNWRRWVAIKKENGAFGLINTMISLFEHSIAIGYQKILVFEDDIKLLSNPHAIVDDLVENLPSDFDLFYLGCNLLLPVEKYSENILRIKAAYSTHAVVYSRKAMENILTYLKSNVNVPYDMTLVKWVQNEGNSYCSRPMIATQRRSVSDISDIEKYKEMPGLEKYLDLENKHILWDVMMKERFELNTKHLL